jgi:hypothetical protein
MKERILILLGGEYSWALYDNVGGLHPEDVFLQIVHVYHNYGNDLANAKLAAHKRDADVILCASMNDSLRRFMLYEICAARKIIIPQLASDDTSAQTASRVYRVYREMYADHAGRPRERALEAENAALKTTIAALEKEREALMQLAGTAGAIHDDVLQLRDAVERMTML